MKKYLTILFLAFQWFMSSQVENFNPKKNLYFGANIGLNQIDTKSEKPKSGFQGGVFAEYYFAKQWSITGKISYFETGLDYYHFYPGYASSGGFGGFFGGGSPSRLYSANFSSEVLATSLQIKWEFRLYNIFKGYWKTGIGLYLETHSKYENYIGDKNNGIYSSTFSSVLAGFGVTYFINDKYAIFAEIENHLGAAKFQSNDGWNFGGTGKRFASNHLIGVGVKYKFKNFTKNENTN